MIDAVESIGHTGASAWAHRQIKTIWDRCKTLSVASFPWIELRLWLTGTVLLLLMFFLGLTTLIAVFSLSARVALMPFGVELLRFPNSLVASVHTSPTGIVSRFFVVPDAEMGTALRHAVYMSPSAHGELAQWIRSLPGGPRPANREAPFVSRKPLSYLESRVIHSYVILFRITQPLIG